MICTKHIQWIVPGILQRSHVFQRPCKGNGRWTKLEDGLRLELPRNTLLEVEIVTELRGEVNIEFE